MERQFKLLRIMNSLVIIDGQDDSYAAVKVLFVGTMKEVCNQIQLMANEIPDLAKDAAVKKQLAIQGAMFRAQRAREDQLRNEVVDRAIRHNTEIDETRRKEAQLAALKNVENAAMSMLRKVKLEFTAFSDPISACTHYLRLLGGDLKKIMVQVTSNDTHECTIKWDGQTWTSRDRSKSEAKMKACDELYRYLLREYVANPSISSQSLDRLPTVHIEKEWNQATQPDDVKDLEVDFRKTVKVYDDFKSKPVDWVAQIGGAIDRMGLICERVAEYYYIHSLDDRISIVLTDLETEVSFNALINAANIKYSDNS